MNKYDFHYENGQYHCSNDECDWWVPEEMEYLAEDHDCEEYADLTLEEFFKLTEEETESVETASEMVASGKTIEEWDERADEVVEGEEGEEWIPIDEIEESEGADIEAMLDGVPTKEEVDSLTDEIDGVDLDEHMDELLDGEEVDEMCEDDDED